MPKRNSIEDTVQLDQEEIYDALQQDNHDKTPRNKKFIIIVGVSILVFFVLAIGLIKLFHKSDDTTTTPQVSEPSSDTQSTTLDTLQLEKVNEVIVETLDTAYGTDGYTHPTDDQYQISGSANDLHVKVNITVKKDSTSYTVPCQFQLKWSDTDETFDVVTFTKEDTHVSATATSTPSQDEQVKGEEVKSYDVSVQNAITVTITSKSEGEVTAVATDSNGKQTVLASVSNDTVTKTVNLEPGDYTIALYTENGTDYHWSYSLE